MPPVWFEIGLCKFFSARAAITYSEKLRLAGKLATVYMLKRGPAKISKTVYWR